LSYNYFLYLYQ